MQPPRPDKKAVIGESLTDEQLKKFLDSAKSTRTLTEFDILLKAYRGMTANDFARFIHLFLTEGHNINAQDTQGKTLLNIIKTHASSKEYVDILQRAGRAS